MKGINKVRNFHRTCAILWALLLIPACLFWSESVLFVIIASVYANVKSDWGAAEAADDTDVLTELGKIERTLDSILERLNDLEK